MANDKKAISLPSILAFERKLEVSDALMYAGAWDDVSQSDSGKWQPIKITTRQNRSTQSAYGIKDEAKTQPNPVSSDSQDANLPHDRDTLKVSFTLRVIGNVASPFSCNEPAFEKALAEKVTDFKDSGLKELAYRYAHNIASGRFLWRNRVCAESVLVKTELSDEKGSFEFNGYDFPLNDFSAKRNNADLEELADAIFQGLSSESDFVCVKVDAYVRLGNGQHVFPSQEMNMGEKKKVLFKLDNCAALHSVKVGNAIRTIDDWYVNAKVPIAVEPYGSVTQRGEAYRPSKNDLYTLMLDWVNDKEISDEQRCFVLANFIRGGVFGGKSD